MAVRSIFLFQKKAFNLLTISQLREGSKKAITRREKPQKIFGMTKRLNYAG